ncbi:MAG TPA: Ni/Fe hydrogenase subunit alpha [Candidatus Competibacter sp.]|jgi:NAD-reducing hydrogenase large subunit|nr:Ni/Fe hydrogenase subunit alpha [Candidatus Competibacter sp.]HUM89965.1 Ni/Fe hydrogenase subunit alpha [Candidatus Competibacter sp.]
MSTLETAAQQDYLCRVAIDPLSRVEGHGKVTLLVDKEHHIRQARLHIVEFRGFEKFIQGRPYWELPVVVQRLCGICPVSHHLAAAKAVDQLIGALEIPPTAEKIRRLMHYGQTLQSHAVHFFHLASPDFLFDFDDTTAHRNIGGVMADYPDIARQGVRLRKYGQEIIRATAGKRVHGTGAIPGGVNKALTLQERNALLIDLDLMVQWGRSILKLIKSAYGQNPGYFTYFATIRTNYLSLIRADGALDLYHGGLRARNETGTVLFDHLDYRRYSQVLREQVKPWSYMKFPFINSLGPEKGWYRVGPLARINNCDFIPTPLAEEERKEFMALGNGEPIHVTLAYHWARMIELLHAIEAIRELLLDPDIFGDELVVRGEMAREGIGVIEAPRGTLFHHYRMNEDGLIEKANLIVSTTNNNQAMNESIRQVAERYLDGKELTEPLLNQIEVAVRAYDPCLSCATHALGQMPLHVTLVEEDSGEVLDGLVRDADGTVRNEKTSPVSAG